MRLKTPVQSGLRAAYLVLAAVVVASLPARMQLLMRGHGPLSMRLVRVLAGALLDATTAIVVLVPLVVVLTVALPALVGRFRTASYQRFGPLLMVAPFAFAVWLFTVIAQEVKSERGSFPTLFDLSEGFGNAAFVQGAVDFVLYERIYLPALVCIAIFVVLVFVLTFRREADASRFGVWSGAVVAGVVVGFLMLFGLRNTLASWNHQFTPAALGDPLTGLFESAADVLRRRGASTPRQLVLEAEFPARSAAIGASLVGWPVSTAKVAGCEMPKRSLDEKWAMPSDGQKLTDSFERVSSALFQNQSGDVAVFFLSLEGFRADDLHWFNPLAPVSIAPFTNALYEQSKQAGRSGVLTSPKLYQAGVRTAHCLGAMTCGVGTLPYNLSFIRDLQPFAIRCASDVLSEAGFTHAFFYGSDGHFDEMDLFFKAHHYEKFVDQTGFPANAPKGTWNGVTDFVVFETAVRDAAERLNAKASPFTFVMSLSNHSPFTPPEDLPAEVQARVKDSLKSIINRADADDTKRLMTYSYTDEALKRFFDALESNQILGRSLVVLMADHSTGHDYIWGSQGVEDDNAKARIPFAVVLPKALRESASNAAELTSALDRAQGELASTVLSQNDVPTLLLALLKHHPNVERLQAAARWHSMGGQVTSPFFDAPPGAAIMGINGVSELFVLDQKGERVGDYQDSVFLKTRADRYRVTPMLIPVAARLPQSMTCPQ
jgi:hypothetical protein